MNDYIMPILFIFLFLMVFMVLISLFLPSANLVFQLGIVKKYQKVQLGVDYFRDMLTYSPSEIYYIYNKNFRYNLKDAEFKKRKFQKLLYINLLKMNVLKYVDIDFTNKKNFKITKKDILIIDQEYAMINNLIFNKITSNNEITLYEIYDYVYNHYNDEFFIMWDKMINNKIESRGFYIGNFISFYGNRIKRFYSITIPIIVVLIIVLSIISIKFGLLMIFLSALLLIFGFYETKRLRVISDSGIYEYRKMVALKKFLQDFSVIEEHGPEISKLLEDYAVYAGIFDLLKDDI